MSEQVFKSPGFFEREIEIQAKPPRTEPNSSPIGIIGPAEKGPAFIPVILNSMDDYKKVFGKIQKDKLAGHAVSEFFTTKNGGAAAIQFIRTLGLNESAGFKLTQSGTNNNYGGVQFLCADHLQAADDKYVNGMFAFNTNLSADNNSNQQTRIKLIRGVLFLHKSCYLSGTNTNASGEFTVTVNVDTGSTINNRTVTASLNPAANNYIANVLNTDPYALEEYGYVLYSHFPIDDDFLSNKFNNLTVSFVRPANADKATAFGNFQTGFKTPQTTNFISQPFGNKEYDLFSFEAIDDGAFAAGKYKISVGGLRASTDVNYKFGTFNVQLRDLNDTDEDPIVLESYTNCSLDPTSSNYIAKLIGDQKKYYTYYDSATNAVISSIERRIYTEGENPNQSTRIRVKMSADVINGEIPQDALPFGFRGLPSLKTSTNADLKDVVGYILPPLPYRFKVTTGQLIKGSEHEAYIGKSTSSQTVSAAMYWGLMNFNIDAKETANNRATAGDRINRIVENYTKLMAVDPAVLNAANSSEADSFNDHKFTLARVAFAKAYTDTAVNDLSSSISETFKEVIYVRNGDYMNQNYTITNALLDNNVNQSLTLDTRITFATVLSESKDKFNRYSAMAKFTAPMFGGFDGLNIFDKDSMNMNDRASSTENTVGGVTGKAIAYVSGLSDTSANVPMHGDKVANVVIGAYTTAADILLEPATASVHVVLTPGIRDSLVTNYIIKKTEEFGKAIYLMDIPHYDRNGVRLYDDSVDELRRPDVDQTINYLASRNLDSSYVATYFPDVLLDDASDIQTQKRVMRCPSSIVALGALAKSEKSGPAIQPWFAPAGFENGLNTRVRGVTSRLRADDRDSLYEARINPIASFPSNQYVIFGQKTLQIANSALTRVNVRRLMIEIKRGIERIAQTLLFEQNNAIVRNNFLLSANAFLSNVQTNSGIENYRVTLTTDDSDMNSLNGQIIIVPTRVVEFIAMDFVITNSGVTFA